MSNLYLVDLCYTTIVWDLTTDEMLSSSATECNSDVCEFEDLGKLEFVEKKKFNPRNKRPAMAKSNEVQ
jgi:hypothetical protein